MVVITRRGRVKRVLVRRDVSGAVPSRPGLLSPGVSVVDVVYWSAVAKTVEEADGIVMQRVELVPTRLLVTDGRTEWELDISDRVAELVRESGYEPLFGSHQSE